MVESQRKPERQKIKESLSRIHLGRAALALSAIEVPSAVLSIILDSPTPIAAGSALAIAAGGETIWEFIQNRNHPVDAMPRYARWFAKKDSLEQK